MVASTAVFQTINTLAVEKGDRQGNVYHLTVTTEELMSMFNLKPSIPHHRYVKGLIEMHYPKTTVELVGREDGSQGFKLHIKIWSK